MKKTKNLLFCLVIIFGMTGFIACSDDDNTNPSEVEEGKDGELLEAETLTEGADSDENEGAAGDVEGMSDQQLQLLHQQSAIINIIKTLTGTEEVTIPLNTYEPNYGIVLDESNPLLRIVVCETTEQAEADFRSIVGYNDLLTPTSDGYTVSLRNVPWDEEGTTVTLGTLTFHRGDGTENMGSIDVDIRCIPTLGRIDYLPRAIMPENGPNDSPYLLGDLVYLPRGNTYCSGYYVCVRQTTSGSGGLLVHLCEGEARDDETINLDGDSQGCWYPFNNSKGMKTESGHIEAYISFLMEEKTLVDNIKFYLNGKIHDRKPSQSGKLKHVLPGGFNNEQGYVYKSTNGKGARIFYDAEYTDENYYWIFGGTFRRAKYWWVTNNCTGKSWTYVYPTTYDYYKDKTWNGFADDANPFTMNVITFKKSPVSGATIEYSPTTQNVTFENDARFATKTHLGWVYTSSNRLYENASKAKRAGQQPIGVLVYVNDGSDFGNMVTEKENGGGHGLVMAYGLGSNKSVRWNFSNSSLVSLDESMDFPQFVNKTNGTTAALTDGNGSGKTRELSYLGSKAAQLALDYKPEAPLQSMGWMLPSAGQWIAIRCDGLGGAKRPSPSNAFPTFFESGSGDPYENIDKHINDGAVNRYRFSKSDKYWSSSAYNSTTGIYLEGNSICLTWYNWSQYAYVRPVFAY